MIRAWLSLILMFCEIFYVPLENPSPGCVCLASFSLSQDKWLNSMTCSAFAVLCFHYKQPVIYEANVEFVERQDMSYLINGIQEVPRILINRKPWFIFPRTFD